MPFPFLFLALALASGILLSSRLPLPLSLPAIALGLSLFLAWIFYLTKKDKLAFAFIILSTIFLGSSLYSVHNKNYEANPLVRSAFRDYADFYGRLYKSPSRGQDRFYLFLRVEKVRIRNREEPLRGNLRISVLPSPQDSVSRDLLTGDRVKISAQLLPDRDFSNFRESSLRWALKSQNIHRRAFTKTSLLLEKNERGHRLSFLRVISLVRQRLQDKIERHFSTPGSKVLSREGAILEALLLGERGRMDNEDNLTLQKSGLFHLIAISGAHIAIITFLLFSVLKIFHMPQRASYLILIVFLVFYAFLVEGRASVLRATIMTLAYLLGKLIWRDANFINTISISAFFLLFINPFNLFDMGFELTFASTFAIILFFPRLIKHLPRLPLKISELLAMSVTAQLGVLPFIASSFNRVAWSFLILNFAAIPLVGVIMALGYGFFPLSFLSSFLAGGLAWAIKFLIRLFLISARLFDPVAIASYRIPTPHLVTMVGYFLFFFLLLLSSQKKIIRWFRRLCFAAFLIVLVTYPFPSISKNLKVTFIDVGQGDSILVEFPGRNKMLIDAGGFPEGIFDTGESVVSPFLWKKGIKRIDYLVLTHAHPDHMKGLKAVAKNFKIIEFWEASSPEEDPSYKEFKAALPKSVFQRSVRRGFSHQVGRVRIDVLHPKSENSPASADLNDQSLVLKITHGENSVLLPGDIGEEAEREIIESGQDIRSQVLKSPHHGSKSSSSEVFLQKVSPRIVVISVGRGNVYNVPHQAVLERYKETGARVFRTDEEGAVEMTLDGRSLFLRTSRQPAPKIANRILEFP